MGCFATKESSNKSPTPRTPLSQSQASKEYKPPSIVLIYFDYYGRAEVIRMVLHYLELDFEDRRFGPEEWIQLKSSTEFGTCPVLEMDGKTLSQTRAILRYICLKKGLYPAGKDQVYLCESLCDLVDDIRLPLIDAARNSDIKKLQDAKVLIPDRLKMIEARLLKNNEGRGFFIGRSITMADFMVFNLLWDNFLSPGRREENEEIVPKLLKTFAEKMMENQDLKAYVESRPLKPY